MASSSSNAGSGTTSTSGSGSGAGTGAGTVTSTLFALLAGFNGVSPTDPTFYKDHVDARRFSFTVGTAASTMAADNTTTPATVAGAKFLVWNGRELYRQKNLELIRTAQDNLSKATATGAVLKARILRMIFADLHPDGLDKNGNLDLPVGAQPCVSKACELYVTFLTTEMNETQFQSTVSKLSASAKKSITDLLALGIEPFVNLKNNLQDTYDKIQKAGQFSVAYTADIRSGKGYNDHKAELIYDYGLSPRINWTANANGEYTDKKTGKNSEGGSAATQFTGKLTKPNSSWGRLPITLSFSGAAKWMTMQKPQYNVQAQLTIPISGGLDLPIVYRYGNKAALEQNNGSQASLGLSVDLSRLTQSLK